jgi:tetratricopeptide (TPR) repeat protein
MSLRWAWLAVLLAWMLVPAPVGLCADRQDEEVRRQLLLAPYLECLDLLRRGQPGEAVARLGEIDEPRLRAILGLVRGKMRAFPPGLDVADMQAAILLHVEAARAENLPYDRKRQLEHVWELVSAAGDRISPNFARDCSLLVLWSLQYRLELDDLVRHLNAGLERFKDDAELRLVQGSLWELLARLQDPGLELPLGLAVDGIADVPKSQFAPVYAFLVGPRKTYEKCAGLYRDVLRRAPPPPSPAAEEIRVRLSHVLAMTGRFDEALEALAPLDAGAASSLPSELKYLEALFRGRALLGLGRPDAAVGEYRRAVSMFPTCQTPYVALSSALRAAGDLAGAREATTTMLSAPAPSVCPSDPWVRYPEGQSWRIEALVDRLHEAVRR